MSRNAENVRKMRNQILDKMESGEDASQAMSSLYDYRNDRHNIATGANTVSSSQKEIIYQSGSDKSTAQGTATSASDGTWESSSGSIEDYEKKLTGAVSAQREVKDSIESYIESLSEKYDSMLEKLTEGNYRDYELYDDIVSEYEALGEKMSNSAVADAAAQNSGNIDTLAAANAHRQVISYKKAGDEAARDAYNESVSNIADSLSQYISDATDAYSLLSQSAEREDDFNLSLLDAYSDYQSAKSKAAESSGNSGIDLDRLQELDEDDASKRYDTYMDMLISIYPEYGEEIRNIFHPI